MAPLQNEKKYTSQDLETQTKNPDLKKLQVEIFNWSINETLNIDSAYTRLFGILRKSGFQWKVSADLNLTDKLLILQTLPAVWMKKSALKLDSNGVVNIRSVKWENITVECGLVWGNSSLF